MLRVPYPAASIQARRSIKVTPIHVATEGTVTATNAAYTNVGSASSPLPAEDHVFLYSGQASADNTSRNAFLRLISGATVLGEAGGEGQGSTTSSAYGAGVLGGVGIVTGDGVNGFQFQAKANASNYRCGAMCAVAVPISVFGVEGVDWFRNCTNSGARVVTDAPTGVYTDVINENSWNLGPTAQDWVLLASYEMDYTNHTAGRKYLARLLVAGVPTGPIYTKEEEITADVHNVQWAQILSGLSGAVQFQTQVQSVGTAEVCARRARLILIRRSKWSQILQAVDAVQDSTLSPTYVDETGLSISITPWVADDFAIEIVSTSTATSNVAQPSLKQLWNSTAGTAACIDSGESLNNVADKPPAWLIRVLQLPAGSTTLVPQIKSANGVATAFFQGRATDPAYHLVWELRTAGG